MTRPLLTLVVCALVWSGCDSSSLQFRHAPKSPHGADNVLDTVDTLGDPPREDTDTTGDLEDPEVDEDDGEDTDETPIEDCPPGVVCVDTFPFVHSSTTTGGDSSLEGYSCALSTDESGPEQRYRVDLAEDGLLVASLDGLPVDVDVDVHILEVIDADDVDPDACIDRGHWDSAALLPAGSYWVIVDSWVDADGVSHDGDYTLTLSETIADGHTDVGLDSDTLDAALYAFDRAWQLGDTERLEYAVLDFAMPSSEPRLFVLDLRNDEILFAELVSHGIGSQDPSDLTMANWFSDVSGSNASSLGLIAAAETYYGTHGYSLRLDGLEEGYNGSVRDRAIVIHSADYATQDFVDDYGYLGRSQGCPAVDPLISDALIDTLTEGALLFAYYPDPVWMGASDYLAGY